MWYLSGHELILVSAFFIMRVIRLYREQFFKKSKQAVEVE